MENLKLCLYKAIIKENSAKAAFVLGKYSLFGYPKSYQKEELIFLEIESRLQENIYFLSQDGKLGNEFEPFCEDI